MKRYTKNTKSIKDLMTQRIASPQNVATVAMPRYTSGKIALPIMRNVRGAIKKEISLKNAGQPRVCMTLHRGTLENPTPKPNGKIRLCVDLTHLNWWVLRERHILLAVDHTLGLLAGAKIFSKLDATSSFWQIPLSDENKLLTTFITPFGRYAFNRLPFGISFGAQTLVASHVSDAGRMRGCSVSRR